jgi:hypothetical protein
VNDWIGFTQDLLYRAGLTPNGNAEASGSSQLINALMTGAAQRPGDIISTAVPQEKMAQNRLLLLAGQIVSITGAYSRMAANIYVGDASNPTAAAFYKCDASGTRTTSGSYMKLPDARGLFLRAAGQNGTYRMADDAPYDGKSIGEFAGDRIRNITGEFNAIGQHRDSGGFIRLGETGAMTTTLRGETYDMNAVLDFSSGYWTVTRFDSSRVVPAGPENNPAFIAAWHCITY